ncbi:MAG: biopolymer transporter ExbD [Bacteroidales bacterium]|jgi:biopolymer transport protein ExbD|nr:biopolymer transporter ExbD [Bacteroidales bacterium]MCK9500212.1 biopolymer transporter ExbD [Bacteroidales bacterium]MDY0313526.1 biopolymer transporter ExbD [Bacteroidales bacterium]NLB85554.1 biopolymer transporter ExbD [Bacteroidales bacterium]
MSKFGNRKKKSVGAIGTSSLPDVVFMILFFFMATTSMREVELRVDLKSSDLPQATEIKKLEKKSLVSYIYVGRPLDQYQTMYGTEPRIQLNSAFAELTDIYEYILAEREMRDEAERPFMTTSLKVHKDTKMGIVTDIKQELRKASALKINYSARHDI